MLRPRGSEKRIKPNFTILRRWEEERLPAHARRLNLLSISASEGRLRLNCEGARPSSDRDLQWLLGKGYIEIFRDRPYSRMRRTFAIATTRGLSALSRGRL